MKVINTKTNESLKLLYARLDEVQMSEPERIKAKEQLASAEAAVEAVFGIGQGAWQLLSALVLRPVRRMTASFG